jgi:hypothetical protein
VTGVAHSKQNFAPGGQLRPAVRASRGQRRRALQAELRLGRVLLLAPGTLHVHSPRAGRGSGLATIAWWLGWVNDWSWDMSATRSRDGAPVAARARVRH